MTANSVGGDRKLVAELVCHGFGAKESAVASIVEVPAQLMKESSLLARKLRVRASRRLRPKVTVFLNGRAPVGRDASGSEGFVSFAGLRSKIVRVFLSPFRGQLAGESS